MPARRALPPRRGIRDRAVPRVLVVTVVMASLVGLVGVLLGTYLISGNQLGAQTGPSLAVPLTTAAGSSPSGSASPEGSLSPSPAPTTASSPAAATTPAARAATTRATKATSAATRASTAGTTAASSATTVTATGVGATEQQVLALTNTQRIAAGCPALVWNDTLAAVARAHSADMAAKNYFDHNNQAGLTPAQRVLAAGYSYTITAENIAAGQATAQDVMTSWMNSPGHKANIVNCSLHELGVGFATGGSYGTYWTQDFGTR